MGITSKELYQVLKMKIIERAPWNHSRRKEEVIFVKYAPSLPPKTGLLSRVKVFIKTLTQIETGIGVASAS